MLRSSGSRSLLALGIELDTPAEVTSFTQFVLAERDVRVHYIYSFSLGLRSHKVGTFPSFSSDDDRVRLDKKLSSIIADAPHIRALSLGPYSKSITDTFPLLSVALKKKPKLRHLRVWAHRLGPAAVGTSSSSLSYDIDAFLQSFAAHEHLASLFSHGNFLSTNAHAGKYASITTLSWTGTTEQLRYLAPLVSCFPSLENLAVHYVLGERTPPLREYRSLNLASQGQTERWTSLRRLAGDARALYALGIAVPVRELLTIENVDCLPGTLTMARTIIEGAYDESMRVEVNVNPPYPYHHNAKILPKMVPANRETIPQSWKLRLGTHCDDPKSDIMGKIVSADTKPHPRSANNPLEPCIIYPPRG